VTLLLVVVAACVLSLIISKTITWAAVKSPFWNIGFAAALVLVGALALVLIVIYLTRTVVHR
jgi:hypothetical protein